MVAKEKQKNAKMEIGQSNNFYRYFIIRRLFYISSKNASHSDLPNHVFNSKSEKFEIT